MPRGNPPGLSGAANASEALAKSSGCLNCHDGAMSTDKKSHDLASDLPKVDTPSLVGLAHSAPYYHDGSAATLDAVLAERAAVHGMSDTASSLSAQQRKDLIAYLQTL